MKIVLTSDTASPTVNGIAVFFENLAGQLVQQGHEVTIVVPAHPRRSFLHRPRGSTLIEIPSLPVARHDDRLTLQFRRRAARKILRRAEADIVHAHTPWFIGGTMLLAARQLGIKTVYTHHVRPENFLPYIPGLLRPTAKRYYANRMIKVLRSTDAVTCPSDSGAAGLSAVTGRRDILIVSNGIELPDEASLARGHIDPGGGGEPEAPMVLYVGRLDRDKGMDQLIEVTQRLHETMTCTVVICGGGSEEGKLRRALAPQIADGRVSLTGKLPPREVAALYERADAVVMTGPNETQPLVALEAMAAGVPVVGFRSAGMIDVVREGETGYLIGTSDTAEMSRHIMEILSNPDLRRRLGGRARELAEAEHSIAASARAFQALYEKLLHGCPVSAPASAEIGSGTGREP